MTYLRGRSYSIPYFVFGHPRFGVNRSAWCAVGITAVGNIAQLGAVVVVPMTMRRPKKLSRPHGNLKAVSRLGPGIETIDLQFIPTMGWEREDVLPETVSHIGGSTRKTPWLISWEVGLGASVERGLKLASIRRKQIPEGEGGEVETEHIVLGEFPRTTVSPLYTLSPT